MPPPRRPWSAANAWEDAHRPISSAPPVCQPVLREFAEWLRDARGNKPGTVQLHLSCAREFLGSICRDGDARESIAALTPSAIESFCVGHSQGAGYASRKHMRFAMRRLLQFAAERGWVAASVRDWVPTIRTYRLSRVVRGVDDETIGRLLESLCDRTAGEIRDRAILLLLATYGVRGCHVRALQLTDLRWRARRIVFREQKGGKPIEHELTAPVARALARYIRHVRPATEHPEVFLRLRNPILPLGRAALGEVVRGRLRRAGLATTAQGTHMFRHAFATRQLREGRSLKVIADLLGHRSLTSTAIYTKVDQPALREVAVEWPEGLR